MLIPEHIQQAACEAFGLYKLEAVRYEEPYEYWKTTRWIQYIWLARVKYHYPRIVDLGIMSSYPWEKPSETVHEGILIVEGAEYRPFLGQRPFKCFRLPASDDTVAPLLQSAVVLPPPRNPNVNETKTASEFSVHTFIDGATGFLQSDLSKLRYDEHLHQLWLQIMSLVEKFAYLVDDPEIGTFILHAPKAR